MRGPASILAFLVVAGTLRVPASAADPTFTCVGTPEVGDPLCLIQDETSECVSSWVLGEAACVHNEPGYACVQSPSTVWNLVCLARGDDYLCAGALLSWLCVQSNAAATCAWATPAPDRECVGPYSAAGEGCDSYDGDTTCYDYRADGAWSRSILGPSNTFVATVKVSWHILSDFHVGRCTHVVSEVRETDRQTFGTSYVSSLPNPLEHSSWVGNETGDLVLDDPCGEDFFGLGLGTGAYRITGERATQHADAAGPATSAAATIDVAHGTFEEREDPNVRVCGIAMQTSLEIHAGSGGVAIPVSRVVPC